MDYSQYSFEDFIAYVMIYAAEADFVITEEERAHIIFKVGSEEFERMLLLFESNSDMQAIEFILAMEKRHVEKGAEGDLMQVIRDVMFSDGEFDTLERNVFTALERLVQHRK